MRLVPVQGRLTDVVSLNERTLFPGSQSEEMPGGTRIVTPPAKWSYAAALPLRLEACARQGFEAAVLRVWLDVECGCVGVGVLSATDELLDQQPLAPAPRRNCRVLPPVARSHVSLLIRDLQPGMRLLFRNWGDADQSSAFRLCGVDVLPAFLRIPADREFGAGQWINLDPRAPRYLEFSINDYCNLDCPFCSEGTQGARRPKKWLSMERLEYCSRIIRAQDFDILKISGGEPTLHPEFRQICESLRDLFPVARYTLATNGARLRRFLDCIAVFDEIDLTHYPGRNDDVIAALESDLPPNVTLYQKRENLELWDLSKECNRDKVRVYENCYLSQGIKVFGDRVFKCPVMTGQIGAKDIGIDDVSVPLAPNWQEALQAIDLEPACRRCFINVDAPLAALDRAEGQSPLSTLAEDPSLIGGRNWKPSALSAAGTA